MTTEFATYESERATFIAKRQEVERALAALPRGDRIAVAAELKRRGLKCDAATIAEVDTERRRLIDEQRRIDGRLTELRSLVRAEREINARSGTAIRSDGTVDYGVLGLMLYGEFVAVRELLEQLLERERK